MQVIQFSKMATDSPKVELRNVSRKAAELRILRVMQSFAASEMLLSQGKIIMSHAGKAYRPVSSRSQPGWLQDFSLLVLLGHHQALKCRSAFTSSVELSIVLLVILSLFRVDFALSPRFGRQRVLRQSICICSCI